MRSQGASLKATRANDFPRQADKCGQASGNLPRSRTDLDDAERHAGIYGSEGWGSNLSERAPSPAPGESLGLHVAATLDRGDEAVRVGQAQDE